MHDLEYDLKNTDWIRDKICSSEVYAQNLYAALCNNDLMKNEVWDILKEKTWSCSWRYAGGIIANIRDQGDYMDWYCSGIRSEVIGFEPEGYINDEIRQDLLRLGWIIKHESE